MKEEKSEDPEKRKSEHIRICLNENVQGENITTGFERWRFRHNPLPEIDFSEIDLSSVFLDKPLKAPLMVSSMTGGTEKAALINRNLAEAAGARGWVLGVGSARAALEREELSASFKVREFAPDIPILANLGAVQLNYGYGLDECRRAVELVGADALVLHLNGLQEVFQPGGNTNLKGLLAKIERLCSSIEVPVGVKEVGWGIGGEAARKLAEAGVSFIDVAGAGGTSWIQVEKHRSADKVLRRAAETFAGWGISTAECVREARAALPDASIIASGGIRNGLDAAKAIALGADLAAFGRILLDPAVQSAELLHEAFEQMELELKIAMFGIGAPNLHALRNTDALIM
ncbi:type 2 isopentenyl-diphosphate Delta-isomerase [Ferviditalea candida]|uniref:Isopentenyl-diphosphate delta-isomerase n=1 Tax=Ferviditalea candida TaxID=3108399 RepID=A0ABU5ZHJ5_9BACL|nr:type 2 isopentenyl-diphosphate Delta-isomerase [Paenibacillaceae bacterium T2]